MLYTYADSLIATTLKQKFLSISARMLRVEVDLILMSFSQNHPSGIANAKLKKHKTKEILFGWSLKDLPLPISLSGTPVERVTTYKLLGVHVTNDLSGCNMSTQFRRRSNRNSLLKTTQMIRGLAVFLCRGDTSCARIRMPSVTLEPHCCSDKGARVITVEGNENNILWQRLFDGAYLHQYRLRHDESTVFQTECSTGNILPTLCAPGQTGPCHHRQTTSCKNICFVYH